MKITANEIKPGMIIEHKNDFWNVLKTQHVKPGKGGAFNQVELKSVLKGTKLNERFRSNESVEKAEVNEKKFNFLYIDGESCHFMDNETFEQVEISKSIAGEKQKLLKVFYIFILDVFQNIERSFSSRMTFVWLIILVHSPTQIDQTDFTFLVAHYVTRMHIDMQPPKAQPERYALRHRRLSRLPC